MVDRQCAKVENGIEKLVEFKIQRSRTRQAREGQSTSRYKAYRKKGVFNEQA